MTTELFRKMHDASERVTAGTGTEAEFRRAWHAWATSEGFQDCAQAGNCPVCDPCPHDCAVGVGHVTTTVPDWSGVIWECTVCHAIGEDTADNTAIVWAEVDE